MKGVLRTLILLAGTFFSVEARADLMSLSYGGRLVEASGRPVPGPVDIQVDFYRAASDNSPIAGVSSQTISNVALDQGVFQVSLALTDADFHKIFPSPSVATYIEIRDTTHNVVFPRQLFSVVPYALKVPVDGKTVSYDASGQLRLGTGPVESGKYLKANADGTVSWDVPALGGSGTVTSVSGVLPITVANGSTLPSISISAANGSTDGYLTKLDWADFNSRAAGNHNHAGVYEPAGLSANVVTSTKIAANAVTTDKIAPCGAGEILKMSGASWACASYAPLNNTGITAGTYTKLTVGADGRATNGSSLVEADIPSLTTAGKVSGNTITSGIIGGSAAISTSGSIEGALITANGQVLSRVYDAGASTSFDWNAANTQYTLASCGAMTFTNMQDGGSYSLAVNGGTSGTCTFSQAGLTFNFVPANGPTIAGKKTVYTFLRMGSNVYVTWVSGF